MQAFVRKLLLVASCLCAFYFVSNDEAQSRASRAIYEYPTPVETSSRPQFLLPLRGSRSGLAIVYDDEPPTVVLYGSGPTNAPRVISSLPPSLGTVVAGTVDSDRGRMFLATRNLRVAAFDLELLRPMWHDSVEPDLGEAKCIDTALTVRDNGDILLSAFLSNSSSVSILVEVLSGRSSIFCDGLVPQALVVRRHGAHAREVHTRAAQLSSVSRSSVLAVRDFVRSAIRGGCGAGFVDATQQNPRKGTASLHPLRASCFAFSSRHGFILGKSSPLSHVASLFFTDALSGSWNFVHSQLRSGDVEVAVYAVVEEDGALPFVVGVDERGSEHTLAFPSTLVSSSFALIPLSESTGVGRKLMCVAGGTHSRTGKGVLVGVEIKGLLQSRILWTLSVPEPVRTIDFVEVRVGNVRREVQSFVVAVSRQRVFIVSCRTGRLVGTLHHDEDVLFGQEHAARLRHMYGIPRVGLPTNLSTQSDGVLWVEMSGGETVALGIDVSEIANQEMGSDTLSVAVVLLVVLCSVVVESWQLLRSYVEENVPLEMFLSGSRGQLQEQGVRNRERRPFSKWDL